jgi:hypothetical protein
LGPVGHGKSWVDRNRSGGPILYTIGIVLVVVGVILWILGAMGRAVGGRRHYW